MSELDKNQLMRLVVAEALRDRRLDAEDKQKIRALALALDVPREEIEAQVRACAAEAPTAGPAEGFDAVAVFTAACEAAAADRVLTRQEEELLFALKEVLGLGDDQYHREMKALQERCRTKVGSVAQDEEDPGDLDPAAISPAEIIGRIIANVEKVIVGKIDVVRLILTAVMANSHVLLEDVPGTGKTMLARALATSIDCVCKRVQFTPDLLPMDVTGTMVFNPQSSEFTFKRGPIFTNVFLADEVNRATPRTQSSLLEVMEERQVSLDGAAYPMARVFFVLATQNPIEQHGTFPLPEAQLDRFLMKLTMGYPGPAGERTMLESHVRGSPISEIRPVVSLREFAALQTWVRRRVTVAPEVMTYVLGVVQALREHGDLALGPSPRASIALMRAGMAYAALEGRDYVIPDDVKFLAPRVLGHRLVLKPGALIKKVRPEDIVGTVLGRVAVPTVRS